MLLNKESLAEIAADEECMQESVPMVRSSRAAGQMRATLNSQAKAWIPSFPSVTATRAVMPRPAPEVPTHNLDQQFHRVVASAKAAVEKTGIAQNVKVVETQTGW